MSKAMVIETGGFTLHTAEPPPQTAPPGVSVPILWQTILALANQIQELQTELEELRAELRLQRAKRFGQSSEKEPAARPVPVASAAEATRATAERTAPAVPGGTSSLPKRKRGGQVGHRGAGRSIPDHLPRETRWVDLPEGARCCPRCHRPYRELTWTEDSEEVDVQVQVRVLRYRRKRYEKRCTCPGARLVTAPVAPKLIPKGKFSGRTWAKFLLDKYQAQVPITRQIQLLHQVDLPVAKGTVHGGFRQLAAYLAPLYAHFLAHLRTARHLHADETRWLVFEEVAGKANHHWWLWLFASPEVAAFVLDPSRSAQVPRQTLSTALPEGPVPPDAQVIHSRDGVRYALSADLQIISADRYRAYPAISDRIRVAFCWAHQRRDFVDLKKAYAGQAELVAWAEGWLTDIAHLYALNHQRLAVRDQPALWAVAQAELEAAVAAMAEQMQLRDGLTNRQRKALESLERHWSGLTIFVTEPDVPLDNNLAERLLRSPVVGRKNYYGHHARWSGELAAMMFTIIQTCHLNGVNPYQFLVHYFAACAQHGRAPTDWLPFSPWALKAPDLIEPQHPP